MVNSFPEFISVLSGVAVGLKDKKAVLCTNRTACVPVEGKVALSQAEFLQFSSEIQQFILNNKEQLLSLEEPEKKSIKKAITRLSKRCFNEDHDNLNFEAHQILQETETLFKEILRSEPTDTARFPSFNPLWRAVVRGDKNGVKALLKEEKSAEITFRDGTSLLECYVNSSRQNPDHEMLALLLAHKGLIFSNPEEKRVEWCLFRLLGQKNPQELNVLVNHFKNTSYSKEEMLCVSRSLFEANGYAFLEACIDHQIPLVFDDLQNPYIVLHENKQTALLTKLHGSSIAPKELLNVEKEDHFFRTPLSRGLRENDIPYLELLVSWGARLKDIPLHEWGSIYKRSPEIYRWLISKMGAEVKDVEDKFHCNLLHLLIKESIPSFSAQLHKDIQELVDLGVSPIQKAGIGETPLEIVKNQRAWSICQIFVTKLGHDPENTPLHKAILENNEEAAKEHIRYYQYRNSLGKTPFDLLVECNRTNLLPIFVPICDFKNHLNQISTNPFYNAIKSHHYELAAEIYHLNYPVIGKEKNECENLATTDPEAHLKFLSITSKQPKLSRLFDACRSNDLTTAKEILNESPRLLNAFSDKTCALGIAISEGAVDVAKYLISLNAIPYGIVRDHDTPGAVPLLEAFRTKSDDLLNLMLDQLSPLPSFDDLLQEEDQIPQDLKLSYLLFAEIFNYLIKTQDIDSIILLSKHPKVASTVKREGIARAIYAGWRDKLDIMIKEGFDLDGIWVKDFKEPFTPLYAAIEKKSVQDVEALLQKGAKLNVPFKDGFQLPMPLVVALATVHSDAEVVKFLIDYNEQRKLPIPWDIVATVLREFNNNNEVLLRYLRANSTLNETDAKAVAKELYSVLFDQKLDISYAFMAVVSHGCTYLKTSDEWFSYIKEVEKFAVTVMPKVNPPMAQHVFKGLQFKSPESETSKIMTQVYFHILCGMNPKLMKEHNCMQRIATMILKTELEFHEGLLLALQTCQSLSEVEQGIHYYIIRKKLGKVPPPALFKLLGNITSQQLQLLTSEKDPVKLKDQLGMEETFKHLHERDFQELGEFLSVRPIENIQEELQGWLNYFTLYRDRLGLILCHRILKYHKSNTVLIKQSLAALERVGIQRWGKNFENRQIKEIIAVIKESKDSSVKMQACKTLWELTKDETNEKIKGLYVKELDHLIQIPQNKPYLLCLIELLGNFNYSTTRVGRAAYIALRSYLLSSDPDKAFVASLSIAKTDDKQGLLECLKVTQGPAWDRYAKDEARSSSHYPGSCLTFRHKPTGLHENRQALRWRILDRLAKMEMSDPEFVSQVEKEVADHKKDPASQPHLQAFVDHFKSIPRTCTRYVGMPLYFPSGTAIGRGLSPRKGDESFFASIQDLIRKGCGTTDLTLETAIVEGSTWSRIGHIFGSHNTKLFFEHEGTYFQGENSAFLVMDSDYYNEEYMRGEGRIECENTFNTVWYRGIPKKHLQALFLEKSNQKDVTALAGNDPIAGIKGNLTSPIFKNLNLKELVEIRRHLQVKDKVNIKGKIVELSLVERIHYYDSTKKPILSADEVEKIGLKFPTEDDLLAESLKRAAARRLIEKKYETQIEPIRKELPIVPPSQPVIPRKVVQSNRNKRITFTVLSVITSAGAIIAALAGATVLKNTTTINHAKLIGRILIFGVGPLMAISSIAFTVFYFKSKKKSLG